MLMNILRIIKRLIRFVFDKNEIIVYSSNLKSIPIQPKIEVKEIIKCLGALENSRIANGDRLFAIFDNVNKVKLIHTSWLKFDEMDMAEVCFKVPLKEGEACIYDCYTKEEFRGWGFYPSMLIHLQKYLKEQDFKKVYTYVEAGNKSSIRGIEKSGFIRESSIKFRRLFGIASQFQTK